MKDATGFLNKDPHCVILAAAYTGSLTKPSPDGAMVDEFFFLMNENNSVCSLVAVVGSGKRLAVEVGRIPDMRDLTGAASLVKRFHWKDNLETFSTRFCRPTDGEMYSSFRTSCYSHSKCAPAPALPGSEVPER